jgi:anti-sigma regulatory factor (Ser/Thr protein kinase)
MSLSEWIKLQIESLRSMIIHDDPPPIPPDGVAESQVEDGLSLRFLSNTSNLGRARRAVEKFCETTGLDQPARDEIGLVINEAVANVMRHAYDNAPDKPIEITLTRIENGVKIKLRDWGNGVNPAHRPETEKDPLVPGGLGLICLKRLMDGVQFTPQPDGMLLEMTRTSSGSKAAHVDNAKSHSGT